MEKVFLLRVISSEGILFEGNIQFLEMNTRDGQVGIYAGHLPQIYRVTKGRISFLEDREKRTADVGNGFAEVLPERLTILVNYASFVSET